MIGQSYRLRKGIRVAARFGLALVLLAMVLAQVRWLDRAILADGREAVVLGVDGNTLRIDDSGTRRTVPTGEIRSISPGIRSLLQQVDWILALFALAVALPIPFLLAKRWEWLLRALGARSSSRRILAVTLRHYVINMVALGTAGGDVYRAAALRSASGGWSTVAASLLFDRLLGLAALGVVAALGSGLMIAQPAIGGIAASLCSVWTGALLLALLLWRARGWWGWTALAEHGGGRLLGVVRRLPRPKWSRAPLSSLRAGAGNFSKVVALLLKDPPVLARVALLSLVAQLLLSLALWFAAKALNLDFSFFAATAIVPSATLIALAFPTPQGMGALEFGIVLLLGRHESGGASSCLLLAMAFRLILLWWAIPGAFLWLHSHGSKGDLEGGATMDGGASDG